MSRKGKTYIKEKTGAGKADIKPTPVLTGVLNTNLATAKPTVKLSLNWSNAESCRAWSLLKQGALQIISALIVMNG